MSTLILSQKDTGKLLDMPEVLANVEQSFKDWAEGEAFMPPKAYLPLKLGDFRAMPAALPGAAGVKWVNVHPGNPARGLPTVMALILYNDPETGYPLAIMDATDITAYRTGASAGIASKYLARADSRTLGIIGAGRQAYSQIEAHMQLFNLESVKVYDRSGKAAMNLIKALPQHPVRECTLEEAATSDIVCTLTPSREPFIKREWLLPGTHINAIGADAAGKEELEPDILKNARVVVDDLQQARYAGEINVPVRKGLFSVDDLYGTLAEIITGHKQGRTDDRMITIFDSTGVAITDIAVARLVYEKAVQSGGYQTTDILGY